MVKKISLTFIISTIQSKKMGPNAYKYRTYNRMLRVLTFFLQVQEGDYLSNINERSKVFRSRREGLIGKIGDTDSVCGTKTFLVVINMVYIFLRNFKLFSSFLKVEEIFIFFFFQFFRIKRLHFTMAILPWFHNFFQRASQKNHQLIKTTMSDRYVEFLVNTLKV